MDTNDKDEPDKTLKDASTADDIKKSEITEISSDSAHPVDLEKENTHPLSTITLRLTHTGYNAWADLQVECSWNTSGSYFTCKTLRYRVKKNDRKRGNITFGIYSSTNWGPFEINKNADQNGEWHDISAGGTVRSITQKASIYFKYVFDVEYDTDPWVEGWWRTTFTPAPPTITNPRVVHIPRPTISGTGASGARVELYEAGVGSVLFGSGGVNKDDTWEITLTEPLWMADPFTMTASQTVNDGTPSDWATPTSLSLIHI